MNPLAWILDSIKVHPEPVSIPDVSELTPIELAEIRSRLQTFSQVATELRKLVDQELAARLEPFAGLRYGDTLYRASNGRGTAKVRDDFDWWVAVVDGLKESPRPEALIAALFPSSSVRLTALPKLEAALSLEEGRLKELYVTYDPPSTPLSVMPIQKAPKYLQDLEEGEIR